MSYIAEDFFLMANLFPKHTGLPFVIWISHRGGARHDVRVKVAPNAKAMTKGLASVAVRPDVRVVKGAIGPQEFNLLRRWIDQNREALISYWDGEIDTEDVLALLKPVK